MNEEDDDWRMKIEKEVLEVTKYGEGLKMQNDLGVKVRVNLKVVK